MSFPDLIGESRFLMFFQGLLYLHTGEIQFVSFRFGVQETGRKNYMEKKNKAKSTGEFDRRFDEGEDIHDLLDMSKARISRPGKKVRITLDVAEELVKDIDQIRKSIGVDRGALIKVWLHERLQQEKTLSGK